MATRERQKAVVRKQARAAQGPQASLRWLRMSPRKVRLVIDLVRGRPVQEAIEVLRRCPKAAARPVEKLIRSAIANADNAGKAFLDTFVIGKAFVDEGPTWRRWLPRAMGRATRLRKRTSHVTIILAEQS